MGVFVEDRDLMPSIKPICGQVLSNGTAHTHARHGPTIAPTPHAPPLVFVLFDDDLRMPPAPLLQGACGGGETSHPLRFGGAGTRRLGVHLEASQEPQRSDQGVWRNATHRDDCFDPLADPVTTHVGTLFSTRQVLKESPCLSACVGTESPSSLNISNRVLDVVFFFFSLACMNLPTL